MDNQEQRVQEQMELAQRIEAMMRARTPETATLFLAHLIAHLDDIKLDLLRIAFNFAEGLLSAEDFFEAAPTPMTEAETLRAIREETDEEELSMAEIIGRELDKDDPGYFIL